MSAINPPIKPKKREESFYKRTSDVFYTDNNQWITNRKVKQVEAQGILFRRTHIYDTPYTSIKKQFKGFHILNVLGEKIYIPLPLKHVCESINASMYILKLEDSWDDEGASTIPEYIWKAGVQFLVSYSSWVFKSQGIIIESPEINPLRDGSIDLSWRTAKARLLVHFRNDDLNIISFYGDEFNDKNSIKGKIKIGDFQEYLAVWMKKLKNS